MKNYRIYTTILMEDESAGIKKVELSLLIMIIEGVNILVSLDIPEFNCLIITTTDSKKSIRTEMSASDPITVTHQRRNELASRQGPDLMIEFDQITNIPSNGSYNSLSKSCHHFRLGV